MDETPKPVLIEKDPLSLWAWVIAAVVWLGLAYGAFILYWPSNNPKKPVSTEILVTGWWWKIGRDASLKLESTSHKATLISIGPKKTETKQEGIWTVTQESNPPIIEVKLGDLAAGTLLKLELVESLGGFFLTPFPSDSALLKESWIADSGSDDE